MIDFDKKSLFIIILRKKHEKMGEIQKRLRQIAVFVGLKDCDFARKIGVKQSTFSSFINSDCDIKVSILCRVLTTFPTINAEWLLTGDGNMMKENRSNSNSNINMDIEIKKLLELNYELTKRYMESQDKIAQLHDENERMREELTKSGFSKEKAPA